MGKGRKEIVKWISEFAGIAIGIQILTKAFDKLHYFEESPIKVGFLFVAGIFVIVGSIFHHRLEKRIKNIHSLFHIIEGTVLAISAILLFEKGKIRLPAFILFVGVMYLVLGVIGSKINDTNYKKYSKPVLRWLGITFVLFGLIAIVINIFNDKDGWVFGVSVLFVLIGLFYSLFTEFILKKIEKMENKNKDNSISAAEEGVN